MPNIVPTLHVKSEGEQTTQLALRLTTAPSKHVTRLTGGCAQMTTEEAEGLNELFAEAFKGYRGAILYGGTRMLATPDCTRIVPGITEVASAIRTHCPESVLLGVVPRVQGMELTQHGLMVSGGFDRDHITIVHPEQDMCLVVQVSVDCTEKWDAEWRECHHISEQLRTHAGFNSLLICYNGGSVTERELCHTAERGWPVLLVRGSGRITDRYATDQAFLDTHPNVSVVDREVGALRAFLTSSGILPPEPLRLVRETECA